MNSEELNPDRCLADFFLIEISSREIRTMLAQTYPQICQNESD
jgi:hypothetical protein